MKTVSKYFKTLKMKTLTLILAIASFSAISNNIFGQTSYINTKDIKVDETRTSMTASIKMNTMKIATGIIKVKMVNQPTGHYRVQLIDSEGKVISSPIILHEESSNTETVNFEKTLSGGMYKIVVTTPNNTTTTQKIMLLM